MEVDRIVSAGKVFNLAIKAGAAATPDWLGTDLHMQLLQFRDTGGSPFSPDCGSEMFLGNPANPTYGQRHYQMLQAGEPAFPRK